MSDRASKYEILKELLLGEEMEQQKELDRQLAYLKDEIKVKEKLEQNVEPILAERFMHFKREFPKEFGPALAATIRKQTKENPEEMMEALSPVVNELIGRYFSDRWTNLKKMTGLAKSSDKKPTDLYREPVYDEEEGSDASLNDIFVIENQSLKMMGHHSKYNSEQDENVYKFLYHTIKDMVKESFESNDRGLEWTDFDNYKIYLITFKRISVACTVSGVPDRKYKMDLEDQVMEFAKDILPEMDADNYEYNEKMTARFLQNHFKDL